MKRIRILLVGWALLMIGVFIFRSILPAYAITRNDFSDPYCASWLWHHGQNPYDRWLATDVNERVVHSNTYIFAVYPPTTYVLVSPLSMLPWKAANLTLALLNLAGVFTTAFALTRIGRFRLDENATWVLIALVFTFSPFHAGIHAGNIAAIVTGLCLLGVWLAGQQRDMAAAAAFATATCLKPQVGIWFLVFYLLQRRWRLVLPASAGGLVVTAIAVLRIRLTPAAWFASYRQNLHFWFKPGGLNDFTTANPQRFELVNAQVALFSIFHNAAAANLAAWALFVTGLLCWWRMMLKNPQCPQPLALSSLFALSLIPIYHRSYDTSILLLALCWSLKPGYTLLRTKAHFITGLLLALAAPTQLLARLFTHAAGLRWIAAAPAITVLLLNVVLLRALLILKREARAETLGQTALAAPAIFGTMTNAVEAIPAPLSEAG